MSEGTHRVEVEFDSRRLEALEREAKLLGVTVAEVVRRATAAWLSEMSDDRSNVTYASEAAEA